MYKEGEKPPTAHELMMGEKEEPKESVVLKGGVDLRNLKKED
jgi:hypothetical protein